MSTKAYGSTDCANVVGARLGGDGDGDGVDPKVDARSFHGPGDCEDVVVRQSETGRSRPEASQSGSDRVPVLQEVEGGGGAGRGGGDGRPIEDEGRGEGRGEGVGGGRGGVNGLTCRVVVEGEGRRAEGDGALNVSNEREVRGEECGVKSAESGVYGGEPLPSPPHLWRPLSALPPDTTHLNAPVAYKHALQTLPLHTLRLGTRCGLQDRSRFKNARIHTQLRRIHHILKTTSSIFKSGVMRLVFDCLIRLLGKHQNRDH